MLGALKVLQSLVEGILEPLDGLDILYVHRVWSEKGGGEGWRDKRKDYLYLHKNEKQTFSINLQDDKTSTAATRTFLNSAACLCKHAILERGFLLLVVNDAP